MFVDTLNLKREGLCGPHFMHGQPLASSLDLLLSYLGEGEAKLSPELL